jgi:hypothetical protein
LKSFTSSWSVQYSRKRRKNSSAPCLVIKQLQSLHLTTNRGAYKHSQFPTPPPSQPAQAPSPFTQNAYPNPPPHPRHPPHPSRLCPRLRHRPHHRLEIHPRFRSRMVLLRPQARHRRVGRAQPRHWLRRARQSRHFRRKLPQECYRGEVVRERESGG